MNGRRGRACTRLAAAAWLVPAIAAAEPATVAGDDGARMQRLSPQAYVILHDDATDEWPHGNTGVIGVNQTAGNMANQANIVAVAAASPNGSE